MRNEQPQIVCLCGSTKFKQYFESVMARETLAGRVVLSVGVFIHDRGITITDEQKMALDKLHLRKIDMSDEVIIICPGGYIGESTSREIDYARIVNKKVSFYDPEKDA